MTHKSNQAANINESTLIQYTTESLWSKFKAMRIGETKIKSSGSFESGISLISDCFVDKPFYVNDIKTVCRTSELDQFKTPLSYLCFIKRLHLWLGCWRNHRLR